MKRLLKISGLITVFALVLAMTSPILAAPPPPVAFNDQLDPASLVASYYNAITLHDYARAYGYWAGNAPNGATLQQFTQGFAGTQSVSALARLPILIDGAAGTIHALIPVVIFATLTTGAQQMFAGCFHVTKSDVPVGNATEPDPNWYLADATLNPTTTVDFVQAASVCISPVESFPTVGQAQNQSTPVDLITSYYDAIASGDFTRAYNDWEPGASGQTLTAFAQGFAGTSSIGVIIALIFDEQGAAGSSYASIPALVTATNQGTPQLYVGCIITRRSNVPVGNATEPDPNWHLYRATLQPVATLALGVQQVWTACVMP